MEPTLGFLETRFQKPQSRLHKGSCSTWAAQDAVFDFFQKQLELVLGE